MRLRLNYELWHRWTVINHPLNQPDPTGKPWLMVPVPDAIYYDINNTAGPQGLLLAETSWQWPSLRTEQLLCRAAGVRHIDQVSETFLVALSALDHTHVLSCHNDSWYLTGRNPILSTEERQAERNTTGTRGGTVPFSELF